MNITVIANREDGVLHFKGSIGEGLASWSSQSAAVLGEVYSVELDVVPAVKIGVTATEQSSGVPSVRISGSRTAIVALVESVDDHDNMLFLRLAPDCLFMAECEGPVPAVGHLVAMELDFHDLQITVVGSLPRSRPE